MTGINIGDKLQAINPCKMTDGKESLTIGKEYKVIEFDDTETCIVINDDSGEEHLYPTDELHRWFDVSKLRLYTYKTSYNI